MKVENMTSSRSYAKVANQFIIVDDDGNEFFQSYQTIIARIPRDSNDPTSLDRDKWDYSRTTGVYRNIFLGETKAETQKKIDSGEYILTDLNI
ncbi:MAG: hypothetical protein KAS32_10665 [Candidatus Peribacteraceae bacterium]|nr:hypothetical protein [Candidatus Peribacteraceae bacterium]